MSSLLEQIWDLLDAVLNWRFNLLFVAGILLAFWIHSRIPDIAWIAACATVVAGALAGLRWQLRS